MPAWIPALKVILPYVTTVATAAIPAFTQWRDGEKSSELVAQQIGELQQAAGQNAESVRLLAEQMQQALKMIEQASEDNARRLRRTQWLAVAACALSVAAVLMAVLR
jgi:hypothetical protein